MSALILTICVVVALAIHFKVIRPLFPQLT